MIDSGVWLFTTAYLLSVASAGPGVAALVSRALTYGWRGMPAFISGFVAGDFVWFLAAVLGVSALADRASGVLIVLKYAGAAYLVYLACRMWSGPVRLGAETPPDVPASRLFLATFVLILGNPKPMMFFLAILPALVDLRRLTAVDMAAMMLAIPVVLVAVMTAYAFVAVRARGLFRDGAAFRLLNRCGAVVMAVAAIWAVTN